MTWIQVTDKSIVWKFWNMSDVMMDSIVTPRHEPDYPDESESTFMDEPSPRKSKIILRKI